MTITKFHTWVRRAKRGTKLKKVQRKWLYTSSISLIMSYRIGNMRISYLHSSLELVIRYQDIWPWDGMAVWKIWVTHALFLLFVSSSNYSRFLLYGLWGFFKTRLAWNIRFGCCPLERDEISDHFFSEIWLRETFCFCILRSQPSNVVTFPSRP